MVLSDEAQVTRCDEPASPQGATVSPGTGQLDAQLFCLSFPEDHGPCPCFHHSLRVPATSGPVLELGCSVSLGRAEVGLLKASLKSGICCAWDRAPSAVLEMMHRGMREG